MILSIDLETRSPVDLKRSGVYRYFENPYTEVMCAAWAIDDAPVQIWHRGDRLPYEIGEAVAFGAEISGWNVNFERQGWNNILGPRHGWPVPKLEQYRCTAAQAAAQALPRKLEKAAAVLRLDAQKDMVGNRLMQTLSKPRKRRKGEPYQTHYWHEDPDDLIRQGLYCMQDVEVERSMRNKLQPLLPSEFLLWRFDQIINDRGVMLDCDLVEDMMAIVTEYNTRLDAAMVDITGGVVTACSQTERLKTWLATHQVEAPSLAKGVIADVMAREMPPQCHRALELWQEASHGSVRKLESARLCVGGDNRARGLLLFHGATSGRWSGQLLQPQNLPRGSGGIPNQDKAIAVMRHRRCDLLDLYYGNPLTAVSDCLRGVICAAPGKQLIAGDFSSVEARITAWLANATEKLKQFEIQDADPENLSKEIYVRAAARIYNIAPEDIRSKNDPRRQTGKTAELALGFGGGVSALDQMARNYHIDMADAYEPLWSAATPEDREMVTDRWKETFAKGNATLPQKAWIACQLVVWGWRRSNKPITDMWDRFHSAAWHTLEDKGVDYEAGRVTFRREHGFMWMTLPSGRKLAYPTPAIENLEVPWSDKRLPKSQREHRDMLTTLAFEQGRAIRVAAYAGLNFQHAVQGIARDLLACGMHNVEAGGYPVILTIHDEVLAEVDDGPVNMAEFLALLCAKRAWAEGIPLIASGWAGQRYRK